MPFDVMGLRPQQNGPAGKFSAVVAHDAERPAIMVNQPVQFTDDAGATNRRIHYQRQALPAALIHDAQNTEPPASSQQACSVFSEQFLHHGLIKLGLGQQLLQLGILALEQAQLLGVGCFHPAILRLPVIKCCIADPVPTAQVAGLGSSFRFLQDPNNLLFRKPLLDHLLLLSGCRL